MAPTTRFDTELAESNDNKNTARGTADHRADMSDLRDQATTLGRDAKHLAETAGEVACNQLDPLEQYVREKPLKSLLIAAGAGALFSMLLSRR